MHEYFVGDVVRFPVQKKIESSILCEKNNIVQNIRELREKTETQIEKKNRSPKQPGFITKQNLKKWRLT